MSGIKTLVRHSSHYVSGQACLMAIGLISFPVFTRVLSVADYGMMELVQRLALVGTAAGKLGVQHALLRFFTPKEFARDPATARRFYSTGIFGATGTALMAGMATGIAFLIAGGKGNPALLAVLTAALASVRALTSIFQNLLRAEEKAAQSNWIAVAGRGVTIASILGLFAWFGPDLRLYFTGTVAVEAAVVGFFAWMVLRRGLIGFGSFDASFFKQMVAFGLPMVAYETLLVALDSSDRFLIRNFVGATPLGYYSAAYTICIYIQDLLMVPINLAMVPIYLRLWNTEGRERTAEFLSDSFRLFIMASACMVAGVAACASSAVTLLASAKYATSAGLIPWIVIGLVLYAATSFFNAALWIEKRTRTMAWLVGTTLVVKIGLNLALLPTFGLLGAVAASIAGYLLLLTMTATASLRVLKIQIDWSLIVKCALCAVIAGAAGLALHLTAPAAELFARAALVAAIYLASLVVLDRVARRTLRQGLIVARQAIQLRLAPAKG